MDVYELIALLGGEIVRNRARVRTGEQIVCIAELVDGAMVLTDEGQRLAEQAAETKTPRKPRAAKVESQAVVSETVEVSVAPETPQPDAAPAE